MKHFNNVITIGVYLIYITLSCYGEFIDDYCWRDHDGIAPTDAFKAGMDRNGDPIYIGQTLFENKLVPGKIHEDSNEIHIEFHTVHVLNETIKIFCTEVPEKFEWYKTRYDTILSIKNKHIFEGGFEKGYITYVGRALSHGEMTVGKVICFDNGCYKLTTIEEGKWYDHTEFEILIYNPDAKGSPTTYKPTVTTRPYPRTTYHPDSEDSSTFSTTDTHNHDSSYGGSTGPGFWTYFILVLVIAALIALVVVLVRRC